MRAAYSITDYAAPPIVAALEHEAREIRQRLLMAMRYARLDELLDELGDTVWLKRLAELRALSLDEQGNIAALYPLSPKPTNKRVYFADGSMAYAMCALDAIGCHYAFNEPVRIESECEACGAEIVLVLNNGQIHVERGGQDIHVLHTDLNQATNWSCACCNIMHFFDCPARLERWVSSHCTTNQRTFPLNLEAANKVAWLLFSN